jgi:hypothetical protein
MHPFHTRAVDNGQYNVVLHMAEMYGNAAQPGKRAFNVLIEGSKVLNSFDITLDVGAYKAVAKSFFVQVNDGNLDITFQAVSTRTQQKELGSNTFRLTH